MAINFTRAASFDFAEMRSLLLQAGRILPRATAYDGFFAA